MNRLVLVTIISWGFAALTTDNTGISIAAFLFPWTLVFHELGHYRAAKKYKLHPRIDWKEPCTYYDTTSAKRKREVLMSGIAWGIVPILVGLPLLGWWSLALLYLYAVGCSSDVKAIRGL